MAALSLLPTYLHFPYPASTLDAVFYTLWVILTAKLFFHREEPLIYDANATHQGGQKKKSFKNHLQRWVNAFTHGPFFVLSSCLCPFAFQLGVISYGAQSLQEHLWITHELVRGPTSKERRAQPPGPLDSVERVVLACGIVIGASGMLLRPDISIALFYVGVGIILMMHMSRLGTDKAYGNGFLALASDLFGIVWLSGPIAISQQYSAFRNGGGYCCIVLVCAIFGDVAAYYVGSLAGRFKAVPNVSKAKTVEGATSVYVVLTVAGMLGSVVFCGLLGYLFFALRHYPFLDMPLSLPWYQYVAVAVLASVCGTFGDLVESTVKRGCGVKDAGTAIGAHGGVLDRFDSMYTSYPVCYFYAIFVLGWVPVV